jgi:uncharacterized phage-associated protein
MSDQTTTPTYDAKAIANFFIEVAALEHKHLTPLQLIKLVYIAHGWYLGLTGNPLINEPPEAWQYGPVIPSLYHALKIYGNGPILEKIAEFRPGPTGPTGPGMKLAMQEVSAPSEPHIRRFLQSVWNRYGKLSASQLSLLTHQPDTPWSHTWEQYRAKYIKGVDIPEDLIKQHYEGLKAKDEPRSARTAESR